MRKTLFILLFILSWTPAISGGADFDSPECAIYLVEMNDALLIDRHRNLLRKIAIISETETPSLHDLPDPLLSNLSRLDWLLDRLQKLQIEMMTLEMLDTDWDELVKKERKVSRTVSSEFRANFAEHLRAEILEDEVEDEVRESVTEMLADNVALPVHLETCEVFMQRYFGRPDPFLKEILPLKVVAFLPERMAKWPFYYYASLATILGPNRRFTESTKAERQKAYRAARDEMYPPDSDVPFNRLIRTFAQLGPRTEAGKQRRESLESAALLASRESVPSIHREMLTAHLIFLQNNKLAPTWDFVRYVKVLEDLTP